MLGDVHGTVFGASFSHMIDFGARDRDVIPIGLCVRTLSQSCHTVRAGSTLGAVPRRLSCTAWMVSVFKVQYSVSFCQL